MARKPKFDPDYMLIGRVLRPHGIRGEIRAEVLTDMPSYFETEMLYLGKNVRQLEGYQAKGVRFHKEKALLTLAGVDDRNGAEGLRGQLVYISREDEFALEDGEFYLHQLVGMRVVTDEGEELGAVRETIQTGANDVLVVRGEGGELLIPDIEGVVLAVNGETAVITVHLVEGLR